MSDRPTEQDWYRGTDAPTVTGNTPPSGDSASSSGAAGAASTASSATSMPGAPRSGGNDRDSTPKSAGQLMKEISEDFSTLFRKEIELAKQELGASLTAKAKGAAIIAVAATLGIFALIFLLLAIRDGLDNLLWTWVADIVTAVILLVIGAIGALIAKKKLATPIKTDLTKQTLKEDVEWAKTLGKQ